MKLTIATWNINSVRLRIDIVRKFLTEFEPDVLCLQETKVANELFPHKPFEELGYVHRAINGQKGYHGVATVSRIPFNGTKAQEFCGKGDTRHVSVTLDGGVELHNFYVPAGGDEPDPEKNEKFAHKLAFLQEMKDFFGKRRGKKTNKLIAVGDMNIAPLESDVWSHKQLLNVVSHTPIEVEHLDAVMKSHQWIDVTRRFIPEPEKLYSWWSYRARDWAASDRGRRLDHIWVTPALADAPVSSEIIREARGWEKPSDHVPVITRFKL